MSEGCVITTVYIYGRQLTWMEEKKKNRSEFIRHAIDIAIDEESGSERQLKSLVKKKAELVTELQRIEEDIEKLSYAKTVADVETMRKDIKSSIIREIRFGCGANRDKLLSYLTDVAKYDPVDLAAVNVDSLIRESIKECLGLSSHE